LGKLGNLEAGVLALRLKKTDYQKKRKAEEATGDKVQRFQAKVHMALGVICFVGLWLGVRKALYVLDRTVFFAFWGAKRL